MMNAKRFFMIPRKPFFNADIRRCNADTRRFTDDNLRPSAFDLRKSAFKIFFQNSHFTLFICLLLCLIWVKISYAQEAMLFRDKLRELETSISRQNQTQLELKDKIAKLQRENLALSQTLEETIKERDALKGEIKNLRGDLATSGLGPTSYAESEDLRKPYLVTSKEKNLDKVVHLNLGFAYGMKGNTKEAIAEYQRASESDPQDKDIHYNLGYLLAQEDRYTEAIAEYKKSIKDLPEDKEAYYNMSLIYANELKDQKTADEYYRKYTELSASDK